MPDLIPVELTVYFNKIEHTFKLEPGIAPPDVGPKTVLNWAQGLVAVTDSGVTEIKPSTPTSHDDDIMMGAYIP
jgi:hypothetical protein